MSQEQKVAILDLGSNTFNLLIVSIENNSFERLHSSKIPVKLGEKGFSLGIITEKAFDRGLLAIQEHLYTIGQWSCEAIYAFATSAVRTASNGQEFIASIAERFSIDVDVIDGEKEAEFIYEGVKLAEALDDRVSLIMDIGGGSTEFVIANKDTCYWKHSFKLGAARIIDLFNPSDPITQDEKETVLQYLESNTKELFTALKKYPVERMVGSSGSFDSIADIIAVKHGKDLITDKSRYNDITLEDFKSVSQALVASSKTERLNMDGLIAMRVDFIVIASLFIDFVLTTSGIDKLTQCSYSLKEGAIADLIKNEQ